MGVCQTPQKVVMVEPLLSGAMQCANLPRELICFPIRLQMMVASPSSMAGKPTHHCSLFAFGATRVPVPTGSSRHFLSTAWLTQAVSDPIPCPMHAQCMPNARPMHAQCTPNARPMHAQCTLNARLNAFSIQDKHNKLVYID
jgi:hypothetical protein